MKTGYSFEYSDSYIRIVNTEDFSLQPPPSMIVFWDQLAEFCREHRCKKVFAEAPICRKNMTTVEAFESGEIAGKKIPGLTIACYRAGFEIDRTMEFFKTVAQNRGVRIEFFDTVSAALKWLNVSQRSEKI